MSYYGRWPRYVPVAERRQKAERQLEKIRRKGGEVSPVVITGRNIANTFWGRAWCDNLQRYSTYANRLPRGRTYVRNGSVIDLQIAPGRVSALVSGSSIYKVAVTVTPLPASVWDSIRSDCAGSVASLVELLQGRLSAGVMERICRQKSGLFPHPSEITFDCSCPDAAMMCKHVAAVLFGVGARLDDQPELLFRLRKVDEKELIASTGDQLLLSKKSPATRRIIAPENDLSAIFGLDLGQNDLTSPLPTTAKASPPPKKSPGVAKTAKTARSVKPAKAKKAVKSAMIAKTRAVKAVSPTKSTRSAKAAKAVSAAKPPKPATAVKTSKTKKRTETTSRRTTKKPS